MNKYIKLLSIFIILIMPTFSNTRDSRDDRVLKLEEILQVITDFENIVNKNPPLRSDFDALYHGESEIEREGGIKAQYCIDQKLEYDTKPCTDALIKLLESYGAKPYTKSGPSYYLLNIKNIITDGRNLPIEIYIDPQVKVCAQEDIFMYAPSKNLEVNAIAVIGNIKYKKIQFMIPCNYYVTKMSKIEGIKIDNKWPDEYQLNIKASSSQK